MSRTAGVALYERDDVWYVVAPTIPLRQAVRGILLSALAETNGKQAEAARRLQLSPRTLNAMLRTHDIPRERVTRRALALSRTSPP